MMMIYENKEMVSAAEINKKWSMSDQMTKVLMIWLYQIHMDINIQFVWTIYSENLEIIH